MKTRYAFVGEPGVRTTGQATAHAAPSPSKRVLIIPPKLGEDWTELIDALARHDIPASVAVDAEPSLQDVARVLIIIPNGGTFHRQIASRAIAENMKVSYASIGSIVDQLLSDTEG